MDDKIKITYPSSEKVYMTGKLHPEIKVGMRKVLLTPTVTVEDGKQTSNKGCPVCGNHGFYNGAMWNSLTD